MSNTHTDVLLAGAFAAFSVDLLVYPLDTLKTRYQSPDYKRIYYDASKNAINRRVLFRGLYQGVGSVILITIPSWAFFTTYEGIKSLLSKANPILAGSSSPLIPQPFLHSAASATAELVSCFILTPAEVLKQNAQMIRRPETGSASKASTTFQQSVTMQALRHFKRPSQLWRGYSALAARNLPFTAMQFPMFEHLKITIKDYRKKNGTFTGSLTETALTTAISAGSAGSIAAIITTPVDVVKTRIMLSAAGESSEDQARKEVQKARKQGDSLQKLASKNGVTKKNSLTVGREVMAESGIKGLFRGGTLRALWTALGSGLYLGVYESGRTFLGDRRAESED
ncbi:S-adenosylmethionine [Hyphodiscus hymeniophilus]|uniref:S-adenosylmethionine n=1 Tax=Hyphodiscus hymeniophilus TaxID=353542 RepID=A0A9P6VL92_9HELO|nr:S-adenosylmethionine [Hyphodiscus hymeniophilus]